MARKIKHFLYVGVILFLLSISVNCFAETEAEYEKIANEILSTMTWPERIAQMFLITAPTGDGAQALQKKYKFGGYVFFGNDFASSTPSEVRTRIGGIKSASKTPMLLSVDEEGGTVTRISGYSQYGHTENDFIFDRSFSTSPASVSTFIQKTVGTMRNKGVVSCLKHFPGYGNNGDTHSEVIVDNRSLNTFKTRDLLPFEAGIRSGCDMIMVSHNIVNCFDSSLPASLSSKVVGYLRNEMGFQGVIVTDSLSMAGVQGYAGNSRGNTAVQAILAGNDMLCLTQYSEELPAIHNAVQNGTIPKSRINASVKRILMMKLRRGIINPTTDLAKYRVPGKPALKSIQLDSQGIMVQWNPAKNAEKYHLYRKSNVDSKWRRVASGNGLRWRDKNVVTGITYTYTVRAEKCICL